MENSHKMTISNLNSLLNGKSIEEARNIAKEHNMSVRITFSDGSPLMVTRDLRDNRINVSTKNGLIESVLNIG